MKYAYIIDGRVNQIIDEYNPDFPDVPLEERYSKDIIDNLVECDDTIHENMDYNYDTGEFTEHVEQDVEEDVDDEEGSERF